tara:strand:- start:31679 stop:32983 length:1305 start_codon:yes stop_codon:yes gene_type:complete
MRLCWISPVDPQLTEIARYSRDLLPYLAQLTDIENVADGTGAVGPRWEGLLAAQLEPIPGAAALPVYHIGNNPLHVDIYTQSVKEPGIVVLHDLSLVDLAKHISHERDDPEWWKDQMVLQYGEDIRALVNRSDRSVNDYRLMVADYPLFLPFVSHALGVVVHSRYAHDVLVTSLPSDLSVCRLNLPVELPAALVSETDYSERPLRFVFCGHVGPNRRLPEFFQAWGRLADPSRISLSLFGKITNRTQLLQQAERCGVAQYLEFHGFVSDKELSEHLQRAHFALNLRWPTMGESSASQLRYWAAGLPTLVTDTGWYAEVPDAVVCKISAQNEIGDLSALLERVIADPQAFADIGRQGFEYCQRNHSMQSYVEGFDAFSRQSFARRLAYSTLDESLVSVIAPMCDSSTDLMLFQPAIETAVALMDNSENDIRENDK